MQSETSFKVSVPSYCLQGSELPFYVLWAKSKEPFVKVSLPRGIVLKELFNVEPKDVRLLKAGFAVTGSRLNGYLGGVFKVEVTGPPQRLASLLFEIREKGDIYRETATVQLFRPSVRIANVPERMSVTRDKRGRITIYHPIEIYNEGSGTALVLFRTTRSSQIKEGPPEGLIRFQGRFVLDFYAGVDKLAEEFPQYKTLLMQWKNLVKSAPKNLGGRMRYLERFEERLTRARRNNEQFQEKTNRMIVESYLKNFNLLTDVDAFLAYVKSISKRNIIMIEVLRSLAVTPKPKKLMAEVLVTDLAANKYSRIRLHPISVTADGSYLVSFYNLFDTGRGSS